jgi:hypothetical protein
MRCSTSQAPVATLVCWNAYPQLGPAVPSRVDGMEMRVAIPPRGSPANTLVRFPL